MNHPESLKVIELASDGLSERDIASQLPISQPTVNRIKNRPEVKKILEDIALKQIIEIAPVIIDNQTNRINLSKDLLNELKDNTNTDLKTEHKLKLIEIAQKDEIQILKNIGIAPSHTLPISIQSLNIYNDNRQTISNTVLNALTNNALNSTSLPDDIVIDVDVEE